ncbi:hypothetical protein BHE74_00050173, partial [Ensete ventricosum]
CSRRITSHSEHCYSCGNRGIVYFAGDLFPTPATSSVSGSANAPATLAPAVTSLCTASNALLQPTSSLPVAASLLTAPFRRFYCTCYNCRFFFLNTLTRLWSFLCFTSQSLPRVLRRPTSIRSQRHSSPAASSSSPPAQAAPSSLSNDSLSSSCGVLSSAPACLKLVPRSAQSRCLLLFLLVELFPHLLPQKLDFRRAFNGDRRTSSSPRLGLLHAGTNHCIFNLHSHNSINHILA